MDEGFGDFVKTSIDQINIITEEIERFSGKNLCTVVVAIDGASGSGKSTFAQLLCSKYRGSLCQFCKSSV
ncbi:MAG: hypothetical protein LBC57_01085 [Treponema sp.]|jgi:ABC-type multidrug transport system fused ATPase/permease subunit|nr:hypothetical protein [Treponema sp.]